jgi:GTPase SAR1 family protein
MADYSFGEWEKACDQIPRQLAEDIIRVAVVGPIKSGKSTFLNSLFKGEFVKRGAGVITSIVTRVRSGKCLRAKLFFKSWDEINAEMEQALVLFPSVSWRSGNDRFDIRQPNERHKLKQALGKLSDDQLITHSTRNINNVLLTSYLKGYDTVTPLLSAENAVQLYKDDRFADHKTFVGNETLAVFLKDVLLEINSSSVQSNIEIADCQGSDSSNPLHLAMIQDYLRLTHLIVYVISSRTGLRQADIRFLSMIKKMGILDNIVFVVNCDFSEHESLDELKDLVERVREELSMIKPAPDVYSFSALFNLFNSNHNGLSDKDRLRLEQWKAEQDFIDLSNRETGRFETVFYGSLSRKRYALLLQNHIERLGVITAGFRDWIGLNRDVFAKNADSVLEILKKLKKHQKRLRKIKSSIKKTLAGAMPEIKSALQQEVHRFFDSHSDGVSKNLHNFINGYTLTSEKYQQNLNDSDFSQILYLVFQDFKQSIDSHITETINPELIRFVQSCEKRVAEYFESVILPFDTVMEEAYEEFNGLFNRAELASEGFDRAPNRSPKIEAVVKSSGLRPPTLVTATYYSAKIKAEAILRLGYYKALRKSKTVLKKAGNQQDETKIKALQDALRRMKRETAKSIVFHLKDYRENLIFGYLYKLVEVVSESFSEAVLAHFQAYFSDLSVTVERIGNSQSDKAQAIQILEEMDRASKELIAALNRIREEIEKSS